LLDKKIELQSKKIEDLKLFKLYITNQLLSSNIIDTVSVSSLGEIVTGTTPSKDKNEYWENGNILWITPSDITEERDINNSNFKLTEAGLKKGRFIPKDSILITCIASIGKNAVIKSNGSCNQQINAIIPNSNYNSNYIYYLINNISKYMQSIAGTSATSIINKEQFSNILVSVHQKDYQDKIDLILSSFEKKIELELSKLDKIQNIKKGLMQSMFV
ncbi:MAG: restriction endonuclease subunit S, partial [Bacilli bacterium]|nr:restriction endonuclease subunit S [Bacilli bacterium]